jgi:hypothetical protein
VACCTVDFCKVNEDLVVAGYENGTINLWSVAEMKVKSRMKLSGYKIDQV